MHRRFPTGVALLDPIANMGIKDVKFQELVAVGLPRRVSFTQAEVLN